MYSYIDANGDTVEVHYTAGKNGFVPIGTIIPKEITALAKAAADLPKVSEEDQLRNRRARSQELEEKAAAVEKEVAPVEKEKEEPVVAKESVKVEKSEPLPAASQVVPVQVVLDAAPETEIKAAVEAAIEKKVETKTA